MGTPSTSTYEAEDLGLWDTIVIFFASFSVLFLGVGLYYYVRERRERQEKESSGFGSSESSTAHKKIKPYKTEVHWLRTLEDISSHLATQIDTSTLSEEKKHDCSHSLQDNRCHGLHLNEASYRLRVNGPNKISPPPKENRWIALFRILLSGFNILLWACVASEVVITVMIKRRAKPQTSFAGASSTEHAHIGGGGGNQRDTQHHGEASLFMELLTPVILTTVIVASSLLQWWSEQTAEGMLESLQAMQTSEKVKVMRIQTEMGRGGGEKRYSI